jgi:hypothetical protein
MTQQQCQQLLPVVWLSVVFPPLLPQVRLLAAGAAAAAARHVLQLHWGTA